MDGDPAEEYDAEELVVQTEEPEAAPFDWSQFDFADDLGIAGRRLLERAKRSSQVKDKAATPAKPSPSTAKKATSSKASKSKLKGKKETLKAAVDRQRSSSVAVRASHQTSGGWLTVV